MAHEWKKYFNTNVKGIDYKCLIGNMNRYDEINRLSNSKLNDKEHYENELWYK